jgi:chemotaxis protein methyltransferase CheR
MSRADAGLQQVLDHVGESLAFDPDYYNEAYLSRRVAARMRRRDADDYGEYLGLLRGDAEERTALMNALTISVTSFFRNPETWTAIADVMGDLAATRHRVNCWSAACADGREPYSLAMLAESDPDVVARRVAIEASDISEPALAAAKAGVYEDTRTSDLAGELAPVDDVEQYVDRDGDTFSVSRRVKRRVSFDRHDLVRDGPRSGKDLVLCRNILIYIDTGHKAAVFDTLVDSLAEGGYLVLGKTETVPPGFNDRLDPVDKRNRIYRRA